MKDLVVADAMPSQAGVTQHAPSACVRNRHRFYHYTDRAHLEGILHEGAIRPDAGTATPDPQRLPPCVWVSSASKWEPICMATLAIGPEGGVGLPRNTVPGQRFEAARMQIKSEATMAWDSFLTNRGTSWSAIMRLAQTGYDYGSNPSEWRVCAGPVTPDQWLNIQLWDGERWKSVPRHKHAYAHGDLSAFMATQGQ